MSVPEAGPSEPPGWTRGDRLAVAAWFVAALLARLPLILRAEGMLDHDQSVVGLMALDVAAGRRLPLFFDGQRYMGALEPLIAAGFVRLLGHGPTTVALAPWLVFGGFVAGQFAVWRSWRGRGVGHVAALLTLICGPLLTVWGVIPRGGYVAILAWTLATLAVYRAVTCPGRPPLTARGQFGCGLLFALGYYLNPLSLILYATLAVDWAFGRHGPELRRARAARWAWLDGRSAPAIWCLIGLSWLVLTTFLVHVDPHEVESGTPYVPFGGLLAGRAWLAVGGAGVLASLGLAGWWSGVLPRLLNLLAPRPWAVLGVVAALTPFVAQGLLTASGRQPPLPSLPVWLGAPWKAGDNLRSGLDALPTLVGSDPRPLDSVFMGQGIDPPETRWPTAALILLALSPMLVAVVLLLLARVAWLSRADWSRLAGLRNGRPGSPERLCLLYLAAATSLYLLQGTSPNASSVRYLVPLWVVLPGLIAAALASLPRSRAIPAAALLLAGWAGVQATTWADIDRHAPARRLARELQARGIRGVVAQTPVAIVVANLSHGAVGALEFRPYWPRLGERYRGRFDPDGPFYCVSDRRFPWGLQGDDAWSPEQDLERELGRLAARYPGRVRRLWSLDGFDVWRADLPVSLLAPPGYWKPGSAPPVDHPAGPIVQASPAATGVDSTPRIVRLSGQ